MTKPVKSDLEQAVMLQVNERLFRDGVISQSIYEQMKHAIIAGMQ